MITLIICSTLFLTLFCAYVMLHKLRSQTSAPLLRQEKIKLAFTGIISFISDTFGIGSFAVTIALSKYFKTFEDEELPAVNNGAQVIPGTLESIFFMQMTQVDWMTLITLVLGTCIGGILGGNIMTRLSQQKVRLAMIFAFSGIIILLFFKQLGFMPEGGEQIALHSWKLTLGFFAMIICGSLTSVGIGLFAMVQGVLFLMGLSPAVAFPIMTTAGAMQQPLTTLVFLKHDKIPLKKTLLLSAFGCIGVAIGLPIVTHLNTNWLHSLLLLIMIYNVITISLTYRRKKNTVSHVLQPGPT
ncbi:MAG: sulfite exporter TauE/SafE family protein [Legionellaceae bacterium]|nr:sulfite exporter TauE/SafE family protein [Legionellaceae bacterium]